jgi:hypothetical protein
MTELRWTLLFVFNGGLPVLKANKSIQLSCRVTDRTQFIVCSEHRPLFYRFQNSRDYFHFPSAS